MEDFAPLWILVVVGAMAYSAITQAQKQKQKDQTPKHGHDEAWPSWPKWDAEPETKTQETEGPFSGKPLIERPFTAPMSSFEDGEDAEPAYEDESRYEEPYATNTPAAPESSSKYAAKPHYMATATVPAAFTTLKAAAPAPQEDEEHHKTQSNDETSDLTADFDLRRAVIYSEILKPKFDE